MVSLGQLGAFALAFVLIVNPWVGNAAAYLCYLGVQAIRHRVGVTVAMTGQMD